MTRADAKATPSVEERIAALVARACGIETSVLHRERAFLAYGLDSVRAVELLGELEATFSIRIADEDLMKMRTLQQATTYIETRLASAGDRSSL